CERTPVILTTTAGGVRVVLHVQPGAGRTELAGVYGDALKVRVRAAPEAGRANEAVVRFLAQQLRVPINRVRILAGFTSRRKLVEIGGVSAADATLALGMEPA